MPRRDRPYSSLERLAYRYVPGLLRSSRALHFWKAEATALGLVVKPKWMHEGEKRARAFLKRSISDPALRRKLTPKYRMGCKRVLLSDTYYRALSQHHVELVTTRIERMTHDGIVTADGKTRKVDVIVYPSGFRPFDQSDKITIRGRDGRLLSEEWQDGPQAFRGVAVTGFPNYFLIMGPNSGLGHNSILFMIECQVRYIRDCLSWLDSGKTDAVQVRPDVQNDFTRRLDDAHRRTVWKNKHKQDGCSSWYVHSSGRNTAIWPGFCIVLLALHAPGEPAGLPPRSAPRACRPAPDAAPSCRLKRAVRTRPRVTRLGRHWAAMLRNWLTSGFGC